MFGQFVYTPKKIIELPEVFASEKKYEFIKKFHDFLCLFSNV